MLTLTNLESHTFVDPSLLPSSLPLQHVEPVIISQKVIQGVYPGVTTSELDE